MVLIPAASANRRREEDFLWNHWQAEGDFLILANSVVLRFVLLMMITKMKNLRVNELKFVVVKTNPSLAKLRLGGARDGCYEIKAIDRDVDKKNN